MLSTALLAITIRELKSSDLYKMTEYYNRFYDEVKENPEFGLTLFDKKPSLLDGMGWFLGFQKACAEGNSVGLIAVEEDDMVGFCQVERRRPKSPVSHRGDFGISVRKEYRGRGIGTMLLRNMIERCRGSFEILELEVLAGNRVARHLYEKFGFKSYGLRPLAIKRNGRYIDEELMYLRL